MGISLQGQPCLNATTHVKNTNFGSNTFSLQRITTEDDAIHPATSNFGVFSSGQVDEYAAGDACAFLNTGKGDNTVLLKPSKGVSYQITDSGDSADFDVLNVDLRTLGGASGKGIDLDVKGFEKITFVDPAGGPLITLNDFDDIGQRPDVSEFLNRNGITLTTGND